MESAVSTEDFNIKLTGDITLTDILTVSASGTLDLNGKTITLPGADSINNIAVSGESGELTLIDGSETEGRIETDYTGNKAYSAIRITEGGALVMGGGVIDSEVYGIYVA
ncbi:MAG: hypothetical protein RBQ77_05855, partial [Candidatus Methanomethylophilaceae archaeon]|nr:hypothetical protein [Candidatus Methanomethylophilaceae archaeon]